MAGDWIKMNKSLPRDPRVVRISSALKADRLRTVGGLLSAWCLADELTEDGKLDAYTPELMDDLVGMAGLSEAMASVGWLTIGNGYLEFPRFDEHNGQSAKRRAQDVVRKMSARKADKLPQEERTKSGLEKRREEKSDITPLSPKGEAKEKSRLPQSETAIRISKLFNRRLTTPWSEKEIKAFKAIGPIDDEDLLKVEAYYFNERAKGNEGRQRRDMLTFLNNYAGEVDRANGSTVVTPPTPKAKRFID